MGPLKRRSSQNLSAGTALKEGIWGYFLFLNIVLSLPKTARETRAKERINLESSLAKRRILLYNNFNLGLEKRNKSKCLRNGWVAMREKKLVYADLGTVDYHHAWRLQKELQYQRMEGAISDTLLFLEHPPVYTMGRRCETHDLVASEDFLKQEGIYVRKTDRGGLATYHGPGQLVGYLIFHLKENHKPSLSWYIWALEEVSILSLASFGIEGRRILGLTGVWVDNRKITAIGVRMSRWVTMHGFAFNLNPNLNHYQGIIPCGIVDKGVTSLEQLIHPCPTMEEIKEVFLNTIIQVFAFQQVERKDFSFSFLLNGQK